MLAWLGGNERIEQKTETTIKGYIGATADPFLHS